MISEFIESSETRKNWPRMYCCSKIWLNVWTSAVSRLLPSLGFPHVQIYSLHPGWVLTDMTRYYLKQGITPPLNEQEGAKTSIHVALDIPFQVDEKIQGEFFDQCKHSDMVHAESN